MLKLLIKSMLLSELNSNLEEVNSNLNSLFIETEISGSFMSALGAGKRASIYLGYTRVEGYSPHALKYVNLSSDQDGMVMVGFGVHPTSEKVLVNVFNATSSDISNGKASGTLILKKD